MIHPPLAPPLPPMSVKGKVFTLLEDYHAHCGIRWHDVPAGFEHDFASIPAVLHVLLPKLGKHNRAAVVHDWLYRSQHLPRAEADAVFYRLMRGCGVGAVRARLMYTGVRAGGGCAWRANKTR